MLIDFGAHRWLRSSREETYSDWLAWIVKQLADDPDAVLDLFSIRDRPPTWSGSQQHMVTVDRETPVKLARWDGRLDLLLRCGENASYIVELKLPDPEHADTAKQRQYMEWLRCQPGIQHYGGTLVALEGEEKLYEGFRLVPWSELCLKLRRSLVRYSLGTRKPVVMSLMLAFVGAVEQNLLRFSSELVQSVMEGKAPLLITPQVANHLEAFLNEV